MASYVYEGGFNLQSVDALEVTMTGDIIWGSWEDGKKYGSIHRASCDDPDNASVRIESQLFDSVEALHLKNHLLFFVSDSNRALYVKDSYHNGGKSAHVSLVAQKFDNLVSISSFDKFVYVADREKGIFAIETFSNGTYSNPRVMPHTKNWFNQSPVTAMVMFESFGFYSLTSYMVLLASVLILSM